MKLSIYKKNGDRSWRLNGKLHRIRGAAYESSNGTKLWYYKDIPYRTNKDEIGRKSFGKSN